MPFSLRSNPYQFRSSSPFAKLFTLTEKPLFNNVFPFVCYVFSFLLLFGFQRSDRPSPSLPSPVITPVGCVYNTRPPFFGRCQHLPIFPSCLQLSIVGTEQLNFRVRNGNGCVNCATTTRELGVDNYILLMKHRGERFKVSSQTGKIKVSSRTGY